MTVALPLLSSLAAVIGQTRRLEIKESWSEPAILWTAVISDGQTCCDAALEGATEPLVLYEHQLAEEMPERIAAYHRQRRNSRARNRYNSYGDDSIDDRVVPVEPVRPRILTHDWNTLALARLLKDQDEQRGLLLACPELDGWLGRSLGNSARGAQDRQIWFDLHAGRSISVETRSSRPAIYAPRASVSVTGMLSPGVLSQKLMRAEGPCALASRILFALPPTQPQRWTDQDLSDDSWQSYADVCAKLLTLSNPRKRLPDESPLWFETVQLSSPGRQCLAEFANEAGQQQLDADESLTTWFGQLPRQAARLALVLHLARWVAEPSVVDPTVCDQTSMMAGITLARWFTHEAQRVMQHLSFAAQQREQQKLLEWVARHDRGATPRDLCRSNRRKYPTVELAGQALDQLSQTQRAVWVTHDPGPQGGRPTRRLVSYYSAPPEETVDSPVIEEQLMTDTDEGAPVAAQEALPEVSSGAPAEIKTIEVEQKDAKVSKGGRKKRKSSENET